MMWVCRCPSVKHGDGFRLEEIVMFEGDAEVSGDRPLRRGRPWYVQRPHRKQLFSKNAYPDDPDRYPRLIGAIIGYPHVRLLAGRWRVYEPHFAAVVVVLLGGFIICVEHPSDAPRVLRLIAASLLILLLLTLRPALLSYMRNRGEPRRTHTLQPQPHYKKLCSD
jgi:hypothetical protein